MGLFENREIRAPVVAGAFYPGDPGQLRTAVERLLVRTVEPRRVIALLVPHAGYVYSGATAGKTLASAELPERLIILCPNHTGWGTPVSCWPGGSWRTPLGEVEVDEDLAARVLEACPAVTADASAHLREHSVEVILPLLQVYLERFRIVPVTVAEQRLGTLLELGRGLAGVLREASPGAAVIVSTDMNHYEDAKTNRTKDDLALKAVTDLDPEALHEACVTRGISMCGFAPAVAALEAAVLVGADHAEIVDYAHSGQVTGDDSEVVSYAGVRIWKEAS